jgi:hypothetical protein
VYTGDLANGESAEGSSDEIQAEWWTMELARIPVTEGSLCIH